MKKKKIVVLVVVLTIIGAAIICGFNYLRMDLVADNVVVELGDEPNQIVSTYATGNINNATLDLSDVDTRVIGEYKASISNNNQTLSFSVEVKDTTSPKAEVAQGLSFLTNESVDAKELVINLNDLSNVYIKFADNSTSKVYTVGGDYTEEVILEDEASNQTTLDASFTVVADIVKPKLKGVKSLTIYIGDKINYLSGITAIDDRDGDITQGIQVNDTKVNLNAVGKYKITYTISDSAGNKTTKKTKVTVFEDKAPTIKGAIDKTIYINNKIDYLVGVSAIDDKDGDLTDSLKVDYSGVDTSQVGTYKVIYSISDSAKHKTEQVIMITVKSKEITAQENITKSSNNNDTKKDTDSDVGSTNDSSGFEFFDVESSGKDYNGDIDAGGKQDVGSWD